MLGGSLTRYHTPSLAGKGLSCHLLTMAAPTIMESVGQGIDAYTRGAMPMEAFEGSREQLTRGLKRKLPGMVYNVAKRKLTGGYKRKRKQVKDILGI